MYNSLDYESCLDCVYFKPQELYESGFLEDSPNAGSALIGECLIKNKLVFEFDSCGGFEYKSSQD